jgi:hypothetical protein
MHDVFTSPAGLDRSLAHVRPGRCVVAVGPALAAGRLGRILNPVGGVVMQRIAVSSLDRDRPWRLLAERVRDLHIERLGPGGALHSVGRGELKPPRRESLQGVEVRMRGESRLRRLSRSLMLPTLRRRAAG